MRGILSHNAAKALNPDSVSSDDVQAIRANKNLPNGRQLHSYANLFFHARNSMMYVLQERHLEICVLRVSTDVLNLNGALVSDRNAAGPAKFYPPSVGLTVLDRALVFAESWDHADELEKRRRKQIRSAEVLVPDRVPPELIAGAYVSCQEAKINLAALAPGLSIAIDAHLFFR